MPILETPRLVLRPLQASDAPRLVALANDFDIAAGSLSMPHPYTRADARQFIAYFQDPYDDATDHVFALVPRALGQLVGMVDLHEQRAHRRAEIGYWVGKPYWNQGYATEAARRVVRFGFEALKLNRIHAGCSASNAGSARVLEKAGLRYEGTFRQHYIRFGVVHDARFYGLLRDEWVDTETDTSPA